MERIAIIEDVGGVRSALTDFFNLQQGFEVLLSCSDYEEFRKQWKEELLSIVLCDIRLPGKSGIEAAWHIKEKSPKTHVMMLTVFEDKEKIFQSLCAGASGYMLKTASLTEIKDGVRDILAGGAAMSPTVALQVIGFFNRRYKEPVTGRCAQLTSREIEILSFLEEGQSNRAIAKSLFLSVDTVKFHIKNIYLKLKVNSRMELISRYRHHLGSIG